METKRCPRCGEEKPATSEHFRPSGKILHSFCRPCLLAYNRERYKRPEVRAKQIARMAENRAYYRHYAMRQRSKTLGIAPPTLEAVQEVMREQACAYCGLPVDDVENFHIDHIQPLAKGGGNERANLTLACSCCNRAKQDMSVQDYLAWIKGVVERSFELG